MRLAPLPLWRRQIDSNFGSTATNFVQAGIAGAVRAFTQRTILEMREK
jgi:hypothetical protein